MSLRFHSTILATAVIATAAVGIASAGIYSDMSAPSAKADRLPVVSATDATYVTVETRSDGISVLERVPVSDRLAGLN